MTFNSIGDLAQGFALRQQNITLKKQMDQLTQELASGLTADVSRHLSGNFISLADVQQRLSLSQSYQRGADQGRLETSLMQTALENVQLSTESLALTGLNLGTSPGATDLSSFTGDARNAATFVFSSLNSSVGGRSLFSGNEVGEIPLVPAETFLAEIQLTVAGAASAIDVMTALDAFFDPGGGFETLIYQGGTAARSAYQLGEGESVALDLRADHPGLRDVLKQIAIISVLDDPGVTLTTSEQLTLASEAGEALLGAQSRLTGIRGELGFAESRIDLAASRISAEQTSLAMIQSELLAIDPFTKATELETVQLRLETLYTITARTARLSLVNFL